MHGDLNMTVRPVQFNIQQSVSFKKKEAYKSYLEAEGAVHTDNNVKPLPPKGVKIENTVNDRQGI